MRARAVVARSTLRSPGSRRSTTASPPTSPSPAATSPPSRRNGSSTASRGRPVPLGPMTGDQTAGEDLRHLPDAGLPVVPLDSGGDWVRVHPLLRELLLAQLSRATSGIEPALHLLASRWHMEHGMPDGSFAHALDAGDALAAGKIFASHLFRLDGTGLRSTRLRWRGGARRHAPKRRGRARSDHRPAGKADAGRGSVSRRRGARPHGAPRVRVTRVTFRPGGARPPGRCQGAPWTSSASAIVRGPR